LMASIIGCRRLKSVWTSCLVSNSTFSILHLCL
jgi:hypothetical protein